MAKKGSKLGLIGCTVLGMCVLCCGGFSGAIVTGVTAMMKGSTPYQEAMVLVQENDTLQQELGTPIAPSFFVTGNMQTSGSSGTASLVWTVSGPEGSAIIYLEADKTAGQWVFDSVIARMDASGDIVDLLEIEAEADVEVITTSSFIAEGRDHLRNGRYDDALYQFDQALALDDENAQAWGGRGEAYLRQGDVENAIVDLKRASAREPDDVELYVLLGEAHTTNKDWASCVDSYTTALLTDSEEARAWYGRSVCYEAQGQPRQARAGAREACTRNHDEGCKMAVRLGQPR